jgi:hypothetical protein
MELFQSTYRSINQEQRGMRVNENKTNVEQPKARIRGTITGAHGCGSLRLKKCYSRTCKILRGASLPETPLSNYYFGMDLMT